MSTTGRQEATDMRVRIRKLLEQERISEARNLLQEALVRDPHDEALLRLQSVLAPPRARTRDAVDVDRTNDLRWLTDNGAQHRGRWVAIHAGMLAAEAMTLDELLERVGTLDLPQAPLIHFID